MPVSEANDPAVDLISRLTPAILKALYALEFAGRHLAPHTLQQLIGAVAGRDTALAAALEESRALEWPERLAPARDCLERAAAAAGEGLANLLAAPQDAQPMLAAYRAMRT